MERKGLASLFLCSAIKQYLTPLIQCPMMSPRVEAWQEGQAGAGGHCHLLGSLPWEAVLTAKPAVGQAECSSPPLP